MAKGPGRRAAPGATGPRANGLAMKRTMRQRSVAVSPRFETLEPRVLLDGGPPPFCTQGFSKHNVDELWAASGGMVTAEVTSFVSSAVTM